MEESAQDRLWRGLVAVEPETIVSSPRQATRQIDGPTSRGTRLTLVASLNRSDLVHSIDQNLQAALDTKATNTLGDISSATAEFFPWAESFVEAQGAIIRLALGGTFLSESRDRVAAYRLLQGYLPQLKLDPERSSDFSYQINRWRVTTSGISNLEINRLSKWSAFATFFTTLAVNPIAVSNVSAIPVRHGPRLEVDVNTSATWVTPLPRENLRQLVREL